MKLLLLCVACTLQACLRIRSARADDPLAVAATLEDIAGVYEALGRLPEALEHLQQAQVPSDLFMLRRMCVTEKPQGPGFESKLWTSKCGWVIVRSWCLYAQLYFAYLRPIYSPGV